MRYAFAAVLAVGCFSPNTNPFNNPGKVTFKDLGPGPCAITSRSVSDAGVFSGTALKPLYTYDEKGRVVTVAFPGESLAPWEISYTSAEPCVMPPPIVNGYEALDAPVFLHGCPSQLTPGLDNIQPPMKLSHDGLGHRLSLEQLPLTAHFYKFSNTWSWGDGTAPTGQTGRVDGNAAPVDSWEVTYTQHDGGYRGVGAYTCLAPPNCIQGATTFRETVETDPLGRVVHLVRDIIGGEFDVQPIDVEYQYDCGPACASAADCPPGPDWSCASSIWGNQCACTPTGPEVCDGHDNNCDGLVDESPQDCRQPGFACENAACACPAANVCGSMCVDRADPSNAFYVTCNGQCLYTALDVANCGACGAVCTGICLGGRCSETLFKDFGDPASLALAGPSIYVANRTGVLSVGPLDGGSTSTVAYLPNSQLFRVEVLGNRVYVGSNSGLLLLRGSGFDTLAPSTGDFALGQGHIYYVGSGGGILQMGLDGGASAMLAPGKAITAVTIDATHLYWLEGAPAGDGGVMSMPLSGGPPIMLADHQSSPTGIAVDATHVYWTANGAVSKVPLAGGPSVVLAANHYVVGGVAVDATHVYWTADDVVLRVPLDGGAAETLGGTMGVGRLPGSLVLDQRYVYWVHATVLGVGLMRTLK